MDNHLREHILIRDPLAVRSFLLASSLRRLGLRASVMDAQDGAHNATFFLATYDLGGPARLRALRSRFPYMPIGERGLRSVLRQRERCCHSRHRVEGTRALAQPNLLAPRMRDQQRPMTPEVEESS